MTTSINLRNAFIVALISITILLSQHWKETDTTTTVTTPSLVVIDHSTRSKEQDLDLLGVSVHHLANNFMDLVRAKYPDSQQIEADEKFIEALGKYDIIGEDVRSKFIELETQDKEAYEYIMGLMNEIKNKPKSEDTTIYEIENLRDLNKNGIIREKGKDTICPIDGEKGAAYVHILQGVDHVGPVSIMLSYTWGYKIGDIVDVLTNYCETNGLNRKEVYVWICCLCVNQHRVVESMKRREDIPFDEFRKVFHGRVTSIGHVIAMMSPW